jgi:hypothetical protein
MDSFRDDPKKQQQGKVSHHRHYAKTTHQVEQHQDNGKHAVGNQTLQRTTH